MGKWAHYTALSIRLHTDMLYWILLYPLHFTLLECRQFDRMLCVQTTVLLLHFPSSGLVLSLYSMSLLQYHRGTFLYTWWVWSPFSIYCDIKQMSGTSYNNVLGKTINHISPFVPLEEHMQFIVHSMFLYCPCRKMQKIKLSHAMLGPCMETPVGIKINDFTLVL